MHIDRQKKFHYSTRIGNIFTYFVGFGIELSDNEVLII